MTNDTKAIRTVIDGRSASVRRGDAEAAVAVSASDIVAYDLQPPLAFSGDAARNADTLRQWMADWATIPTIVLHDPRIMIDGDLAVAHGLSSMSGANEGKDFWYRTTIVLRRADDSWRIVQEHNSVPFLMDGSMKAAVDLQP
ncbi:ketosteroid isomerase-like protein [Sphingomonas sp. UYAg733]